jgi:hypothetical protein
LTTWCLSMGFAPPATVSAESERRRLGGMPASHRDLVNCQMVGA